MSLIAFINNSTFEIKDELDDYIYCVSGAWNGQKTYHKVKLYFDKNSNAYFMLHGYKIPLSDCIKMGV